MKYVALLRGINVGGKTAIKMSVLKERLESAGLENVSTYINSGNIIFESDKTKTHCTMVIEEVIKQEFGHSVPAVVIPEPQFIKIGRGVPKQWGSKSDWKYNVIFLQEPYDIKEIISAIGPLKPDIEELSVGEGVIYQSLSFTQFGKTTSGKLASNPVYKRMTIRNANTLKKLVDLLEA